jgi:alpha-mannosidase
VVGGRGDDNYTGFESPESLLAELSSFQDAAVKHLGHPCDLFGQFKSSFSLLMPEVLSGIGFKAALHAAFDGGRLPRAEQCKTRWGEREGPWIEALSASPLDISRPETWLAFAERAGDSISHDFVATLVVAGWPGQACEYYDDLRRSARYNPVLGKIVTLDEFFRVTRETDDWSSFSPAEYSASTPIEARESLASSRACGFRGDAQTVHRQLSAGLSSIAPTVSQSDANSRIAQEVVINPWNFSAPQFAALNPLDFSGNAAGTSVPPRVFPDVPGCGFAEWQPANAAAVPLVEGRTLRNETLELTVSDVSGGIQSLRAHRDRGTRISQRLVYQARTGQKQSSADWPGGMALETQMIADQIVIGRNDSIVGEITSHGRLVDRSGSLLARFTQTARLVRALPAAIIEVSLDCVQRPAGEPWNSYFASRLAWSDEAISFRRGVQWTSRETTRERIESPEWVEISNGADNMVCVPLGLPFHRRVGPTWLDTLLVTSSENRRQFQFAIALDCLYPTQTAVALATAGRPSFAKLPGPLSDGRGWFLHVSAKNLLMTHCEPLCGERAGIRCRLLETEGRHAEAMLSAFRSFRSARTTDFRGNAKSVLSVNEGKVSLEVGPHRWVQIEAEW